MPIVKIEAQQYVACLFEEQWWVGLIENIDESGGQCQINFMHHKGLVPTSGFYWPMRPDICWISNESIFYIIGTPSTSTSTGRIYTITADEQTTIRGIFDNRHNIVN